MKTRFVIGDEWIYYKVYCGKKTADTILIDIVKPFTEKLIKEEIINKWFFIRYNDPDNHLRIRFQCKNRSHIGTLIDEFKNVLEYYIDHDFIWKIQVDTYHREIERYGKNTIEEAETLFFQDSCASINALSLIREDELLFLFVLKSMDAFLNSFKYDLENKVAFLKLNLERFRIEFNVDKNLNKQLSKKYQKLKLKFESFISMKESEEFNSLLELIKNKNENLKPITNKILKLHSNNILGVSLDNLISSFLHMMLNRQFRDKQRLFELVCYDFLFRYYNCILAKSLKK
ncbi:thiopeptide-type bacteriocin biosynthesis protein [Polaribacter sp. Q13]|uniref:thiopeptide-type bacteriocin biosynthesis protein n=1 Tax=Polaribacter sp. Q13 TaxID=2806551 RepID=UPI00193BEDCD|nr:thiopeptide-type bacteriocin biosynthesis protein [Polaribacter sp. Q13]QVY64619.1 thiopeptide-type bacteriocin biosynthesis protein [Polaribacter sp. Q13]